MNRTFWNLLLVSPAILGLSSVVSTAAIATEATATAEANQVATAQPSESKIVEPVAATPAAPEKLALNSIAPAAETPIANSADAEKLAAIAPETSATELQTAAIDINTAAPIAPATTAAAIAPLPAVTTAQPLPQASDLAVESTPTATAKTEVPAIASTPAAKVEIAQTAPAGMGGPIVPAAPQALPAEPSGAMSQVTSVSQLSDVRPTDWAFQALQSLVERYGCIVGYPDGTYRGNRALTRYEFAAGVNACLDQVTKQISSATSTFVTKDDLAILQRLQEEFAAELATLRGRVDGLEARTAELEANQFSTTTKLAGEAIFLASDSFGDGIGLRDDKTSTTLGYRVRLNFNTSFTGKDLLRTRLQARNVPNYGAATATGTNMARVALTGEDGSQFSLDQLWYRFPAGNATVWFGPKGLRLDDVAELTTPLESPSSGAISAFGRYNPAVFRGPEGAGAAIKYNFGAVRATVAYLASDGDAPNPANGRGVFDGSFSALGQLNFSLSKFIDIGATYNRKYNRGGDVAIMGGTGSALANRPFGQISTASDNFGVQLNLKPSPRFQLGGWYGYTKAHQERGADRDATIQNGALFLALPDFGKPGNLLGFIAGVPPKVTESDVRRDRDTSYHLEGFYRFQVNDFISVTPGVYVILNPEHNKQNDDIWVGVLRTTFSF
ncbi:MAG: iron uptake porin [Microcoleus sp. PH2017_01_SCD_O_A]|uniref:iron uptake porin n=1 Tax=unclassified Microcoleus TaxID=2642155 RepID=UPI001DEAFF0A|nr:MULTISPECIES: iron uptake porin [unclassified Microcoleus]MCC3417046.1 iron uptake porin [Microcoleus sp. PH2017_07_MST_O_A]MCC3428877.1 iron uptake porin [Microcoleus sp. PH2017_04_SCI_O_A]MCC3423013.1 iron uptake porin [Microcoleus sp. PH2017_01_SCD_O_A]MCC3568875.1 iron uptake porin [Microcoleus sp. PH2017_31_RDM_U_A]MCC3577554.1 iron uptake porin [Microcoleus sp. PH2017_32_RDM_D_A]